MNKVYKIVWNAARGCYVVASELARTHQGKKSLKASVLAAFAMAAAGGAVSYADVTVADPSVYGSTVTKTDVSGGTQYDIKNQQVNSDGTKALNRFNDFALNKADIANLHLEKVDKQINIVNNKIDINGVVNALKDSKIGGDVYFFSNKGIAVGANGVFNVGTLTLGTNAKAGEVLYAGGYSVQSDQGTSTWVDRSGFHSGSLADKAANLKNSTYWGGSTAESGAVISIDGTINAKDGLLVSSEGSVNIGSTARIKAVGDAFNAPSYATADAYRNNLVNTKSIKRATTATATAEGIVLSAGGELSYAGDTESYGRSVSIGSDGNLTMTGGEVVSDSGSIALHAGGNLTVTDGEVVSDGGSISVASDKDLTVTKGKVLSEGGKITLKADDNLTLDNGKVYSDGGEITLHADDSLEMALGEVASKGGRITLEADDLTLDNGKVLSGGGEIVMAADDNLNVFNSNVHSEGGNIALSADDDLVINNGEMYSGGGKITMDAAKNLTVSGGDVRSNGGKIALTVSNDTADLQADKNNPENGGLLVIKGSDISSVSDAGNSGDIEITSLRTAMGVARVAIDDSRINAGSTGDVKIHATAETRLYAWDIGDGAYAQVWMGKDTTQGNTVTGKNVEVAARASTDGQVGEASETDAEKDVPDTSSAGGVLSVIMDYGENLRTLGSATKIYADADVDIEKTNINAMGTGKDAGDIRITSDARSSIIPWNIGFLGFGFNVGIATVDSHVDVDNSTLYAKNDVKLAADGYNKVALNLLDLNVVDLTNVLGSVNFSWAELHSDVSTNVGEKATIYSEGDTSLTATSTRALQSTSANGGDFAIAVAVGIADTHATADMAGTVYAKGDVSVKAENTQEKSGDMYVGDAVQAETIIGDGNYTETVTAVKNKVSGWITKLKNVFSSADKTGKTAKNLSSNSSSASSQPWNKLGLNASTSLLFSENDSTASVTGKVRGLSDTETAGKLTGSDDVGAKSLTVDATTISRTSNISTAASRTTATEETTTGADGKTTTTTTDKKKENTGSAAIAYTEQRNHATAYISGDVKTTDDVKVHAETKIPYQNAWTDGATVDKLLAGLKAVGVMRTDLGLSGMFDSWTQSQGVAENAAVAASVSVVNYENGATAYIGKKDKEQQTAPKVEAGGDVNVNATTNITTVNMAGNIADFLDKSVVNLLVNRDIKKNLNTYGWTMEEAAKSGLGGAALAVHQDNTTTAYIDDGAKVTADKNVNVDALTKATNVAISVAGGRAKSVAIDATVDVNRIDDDTKAYIGDAKVISKEDTSVSATDNSTDVNLAGAVGVTSGSASIGASVAYNHIMRDTEAYIDGEVAAGGNAAVNAKNTGEILAASVAGSVTYSSSSSSSGDSGDSSSSGSSSDSSGNLAGSSGLRDEDGNASGTLENLVDGMAGEKTNLSADSSSQISDATSQDSSMSDMSSTSGSLAASANVSVNRIGDNAKAHVGEKVATKRASVTADSLAVTSLNDSTIRAISGAISANASTTPTSNKAIAGAFMYNSITDTNEAYVENANLTLSGNEKKTDDGKEIDEALTVLADNTASILNIAASGSGTTKGTAVAGQVSLNWVDNNTDAHVKDSTVKADEAINVTATDEGEINSYTGAVAFSGGGQGSAVGASVAVNLIQGDTDANIENSSVEGTASSAKGGNVTVDAEENSHIMAIVASGGAADGFAGAFSGTGNWISTSTNAHVDDASQTMKAKNVTVDASNHSSATLGAGSAAIGNNAAGASIAVMVNDSDVTAYANAKNMTADSLSISADNAYNGSASDSESNSTAKTVAVGFAGGASTFAGSGSVTVNVISQDTDAYLGAGEYTIQNGDVTIDAKSTAKLFGMAGGLTVSGGTGIGAAVDVQKYNGHTYSHIEDKATLAASGRVKVHAESEEALTSVAATLVGSLEFAGAGAAGVHDITTDTRAYIGNEEGKSTTGVTAGKDVSVTASDTTSLTTAAGSGGVGATAGVGLSAAVEVVDKTAKAFVGDGVKVTAGASDEENTDSFTVKAENISSSTTAAAGLGAGGTAGVAGAASETFVTHTTDAHVGADANVTAKKGASITADSSFTQDAGAGSMGVSVTAGVGLANSTVSFTGTTTAYTGAGAVIDGGNKVAVSADHTSNLKYGTGAGSVGGTAGVGGSVGVNVLGTTTKAYIAGANSEGNGSITANNADAEGISVTASDTTTLSGGNGGVAIGAGGAGAGAAVGVTNITKDTEAYIGEGAALDTKGKTLLNAKNKEDILNVTVQASGGLAAGLAGAVNVTNLTAITKAYTADGVKMNQTGKAGKDITVNAEHTIERMESGVGGASGGTVGIGAAIDIGTVKTQTNAYLGNNNKVHTDGAFAVTAEDHMEGISSNAVAGAGGVVGVSGSISVYSFGSTMSDSDKALMKGKTDEKATEDTSMESWVNQKVNESDTNKALKAYYKDDDESSSASKGKDTLENIKSKTATQFKSTDPTVGEKGTLAKVGSGSQIEAGSVTVKADDKLSMTNTMGNVAAGMVAAGASVSVVNTDTQTKAYIAGDEGKGNSTANTNKTIITSDRDVKISAASNHQMTSTVVGASASGGASAQGTEETWNDNSSVKALAGNAVQITSAAGKVDITSANTRGFNSTLAGASAALLGAVNGAVITSNVTGSSEASVGDSAEITAQGDLSIKGEADTTLKAEATGASAGAFAGTGTGVSLKSDVTAKAGVGNEAKLSGKDVSVLARNTPTIHADANAAGLGLAGVGITVAKAVSTDKALVTVEDGASLAATNALSIKAKMEKPTNESDYNAYAHAVAGAGGVVSGAVATSLVDMDQETKVTMGGVTLTAKTAEILASHEDAENVEINSVAAGRFSGTGGELKTTVTSDTAVTVGDGTTIDTEEETSIRADNSTEKAWRKSSTASEYSDDKTAVSVGAAIASGNGVVSKTDITHNTSVNLGQVTIYANASDLTKEEETSGMTLYDKNAITIDAHSNIVSIDRSSLSTGGAVGAAHVVNTNTATVNTATTVADGSTLLAGDTDGYAEKTEENVAGDNKIHERHIRGGSIAVTSSNDANMKSTSLVDLYGAAGYAGSENKVTYDGNTTTTFGGSAETAKGDIRLASGRGSHGAAGTIRVEAKGDLLNATAIPISINKDPTATVKGESRLVLSEKGALKSDRDVYLQSTFGETGASGHGEVKDWVNAVKDAFGSDGSSVGKSIVNTTAAATLQGTAETGIHRNQSITIGGTNNNGTWTTDITTEGDISYTVSGDKSSGAALSERLKKLKEELSAHISDPSAKTAYEAEIEFVQNKMIEQGLAYMETVTDETTGKTTTVFVEVDPSSTTEYADAVTTYNNMAGTDGAYAQMSSRVKTQQAAIAESKKALDNLGALHTKWTEAKTASENALTAKTKANDTYTQAETALRDAVAKSLTAESTGSTQGSTGSAGSSITVTKTPTDAEVKSYIESNPNDAAVKSYTSAKEAKEKADTAYASSVTTVNTALSAYVAAVKAENYTISDDGVMAKSVQDKIRSDYTALGTLSESYTTALASEEAAMNKLSAQIKATDAFFTAGGMEEGGKFYLDGTELTAYNGYDLLHKNAYAYMTRDVTIGDVKAQLGDIYLEGDTVSGSGTLTAHNDANVTITNNSPNNLVVSDVRIEKDRDDTYITSGGSFYLNGNAITSKTTLEDLKLKTSDTTENSTPTVEISSTFSPTNPSYMVETAGASLPLYTSPTTTIQEGKTIYNARGSVSVLSKSGDVYNNGSIVAGSVSMTAENGDFIQSYSNRIANIGGDPFKETTKQVADTDENGNEKKDENGNTIMKDVTTYAENESLGSGILANGNIFISARYVNINSKIQSGVASYDFEIPETPTFYYKDGTGYVACEADTTGKGTIYVGNSSGIISESVTYDQDSKNIVVSGLEVRGGKVSIVGTIINTTNDTSKARIEALDGYGAISINNKSSYNLELKGLDTGTGVEGVIEITDLDTATGAPKTKTTYTRTDGKILQSVESYKDGTWQAPTSTDVTGNAVYTPQADQHYVFQTGTSIGETNVYEYHGTRCDWFGITDETPSREELIAMGAKLTQTIVGNETPLVDGTFISTSKEYTASDGTTKISIGEGKQQEWEVTNTSTLDEGSSYVKSKRLWYTFGLGKKYDVKLVIKDDKTKFKQYETGASNNIGIGFNGNESGGTVSIAGGSGNVKLSGSITNTGGTTTITGGSITQGDIGSINTKVLNLTAATGSVGEGNAIRTSASDITGSAEKGSFRLESTSAASVGAITARDKVSLTAEGGLTQKADTLVSADRVELYGGEGGITGESGSFLIKTGQPTKEATKNGTEQNYGLKASADGDISITNQGGDLYLDSVISENGKVTLATDGSFIDNNFTDLTNESAQSKLLGWANAAVLEGSGETVNKQKELLIAKVEGKYSEYLALMESVDKDGNYTLDDSTRTALEAAGVDADAYIAQKQARYDALKDTVGTWGWGDKEANDAVKDKVSAYVQTIKDSDSSIYGNASITAADLTGDTYLTAEEKAEVLVGSAKSAKDLLVSFAPGSIKQGITNTNTTLKGTPHVSGSEVSLTSTGGSIGEKKTGMEIDLTDPSRLTKAELLALSTAERGDFTIDGNTVTVSSVRSIDAETSTTLSALANKGSIYLVSQGDVGSGSTLASAGEVRLKASGSLTGLTVTGGEKENLILEAGEGAISDVTIKGSGVLTARAQDGVDIEKSDGDLVVNTVYASEGDVVIDMNGASLLAETRDDKEATSYINIEGNNITIEDAKDLKGEDDTTTLGLATAGATDEAGNNTNGTIIAKATGDANISTFYNLMSADNTIEAKNLSLTNRGVISAGLYKATSLLSVSNALDGDIIGGTFEGTQTTLSNAGDIEKRNDAGSTPTFTGTNSLTVENSGAGKLNDATLKGDTVKISNSLLSTMEENNLVADKLLEVTNKGTYKNNGLTNSTETENSADITINNDHEMVQENHIVTTGKLTINNRASTYTETVTVDGKEVTVEKATVGTITGGTYSGKTMEINNAGTMTDGTYTATDGALTLTNTTQTVTTTNNGKKESTTFTGTTTGGTYTGKTVTINNGGTIKDADFEATEGHLTVDNKEGTIEGGTYTAKTDLTYENGEKLSDAKFIATDGSINVSSAGSIGFAQANAAGSITILEKGDADVTITKAAAGENLTVTATAGSITGDELTATKGNATLTAEKNVTVNESLIAGKDTTVTATTGELTVNEMTAGENAALTANGTVKLTSATAGNDLTVTSTDSDIEAGTLAATKGNANITAKDAVKLGSLTSGKDSNVTARNLNLEAGTIDAKGAVELTAGDGLTVGTLEAGTDAEASAKNDVKITTGTAGNNLTIESTAGSVKAETLTATTGNASITAHHDVTISNSLISGGDSNVTAEDGSLTANTIHAEGAVELTAGDILKITELEAGTNAEASAKNDVKITTGTAGNNLTIESTAGDIKAETLEATRGNASITAAEAVTIKDSLTTGGDSNITTEEGELTATTIDAKGAAELIAGDTLDVTTLKAGTNAEASAKNDVKITTSTAGNNLTVESTAGDVEAETLTATRGNADITAGGRVNITESLTTGKDATVKANDGNLKATLIDAGESADLYASGSMTIGTLKAGKDAEASAESDVAITTGMAGDNLTIESTEGNVEAGMLTATNGNADITAGKNISISALTAGKDTTVKALGGSLTADAITANETADLYSKGLMDIETLTAKDAILNSDDSIEAANTAIGNTLSMKADKDIIVSQSDSVTLDMTAGGTIATEGKDAHISADTLTMTAGKDILITDRSPVEKLDGVDLDEEASETTGTGEAGSFITGEAKGHTFDVSQKGSATLTARKGEAVLNAEKVEIDTAEIGTDSTISPSSLDITADNVGIDDLQSASEVLNVKINGQDGRETHYAGIHNTTDGQVNVKDSRVEHLNFTGGNDIGLENTALGGDSILQTEKVLVTLRKNPNNNTSEYFGQLSIHDYDITSSKYFTRLRNGLTINGERFPYTADSVMNKSLFGYDIYLGRDGVEREEEDTLLAKELAFGEVTDTEAYHPVNQ